MENKRVILAVVLSLAILVGWNFLFPPAKSPVPRPDQKQTAQTPSAPEVVKPAPKAESLTAFAPTPGKKVTVDTPLYTAVFNSSGGVLERFSLKRYHQTLEPDSPLVDLVGEAVAKAPLGLLINGAPTWQGQEWAVEGSDLTLAAGGTGTLVFTGRMGETVIRRAITFSGDGYLLDEKLSLSNTSGTPIRGRLALTMSSVSF